MFVITVLRHTPIWVWVLLAFLIYRGIMMLRPREVSPSRMLIIPVVFLVWGLTGMVGADGLGVKLRSLRAAFSWVWPAGALSPRSSRRQNGRAPPVSSPCQARPSR